MSLNFNFLCPNLTFCLDAHPVDAFAANFRFNDSSRETSSSPHMQSGHKSKHMSCGFKKYSAEKCSIEETVVIMIALILNEQTCFSFYVR